MIFKRYEVWVRYVGDMANLSSHKDATSSGFFLRKSAQDWADGVNRHHALHNAIFKRDKSFECYVVDRKQEA